MLKEFKKVIPILVMVILLALFCPAIAQAAESLNNYIEVIPEFNISIAVVSSLIILLLGLFIWEPMPIGIIALAVPVILAVLNLWTKVSTEQALSGFSNKATVTVMAMFILSRGIQNSGAVQLLGNKLEAFTGDNQKKQVGAITTFTGIMASIINNTPVVAAFVPMVTNLARRTKVSPSKLLIPLSYASMLGGTITLLGTSTNILASQVSARLIDHPFGMFEFTKLGIIVFIVGLIYLVTIGYYLIPERIKLESDNLIRDYQMEEFLSEVKINDDSPLLGKSIGEVFKGLDQDLDIIQMSRKGERFMEPLDVKTIRAEDHLVIRGSKKTLLEFIKNKGIALLADIKINQHQLEDSIQGQKIIEVIISDNSFMTGQTINNVNFLERYDASLLAIKHGEKISYENLKKLTLKAGDVLLLLVTDTTLKRLEKNMSFIIEDDLEETNYSPSKICLALGILAAVIGLASMKIISIAIATLAGVIAMVASDLVKPKEVYEAINWEVVFLLAGLIPLGVTIEQTGTAQFIANQLLRVTGIFPPVVILGIFYYFTVLLTNVISNNATAVLMIPVAVNAAHQIGANPFAFVLAVTFAASAAFSSPIGYQTNLMIYGPGGYKFRDFIRVGAPLEIILAVIVPLFISIFWGI
ncbi:SLC13 family permease [Orenia metallireducens]|uniref:SLC13 family permease n=1 Tax=Orenia metallireducens TaxID=1413210 RepID=UPI001146DC9F|nr:SLC13 family permease [Orenia metallireducens]